MICLQLQHQIWEMEVMEEMPEMETELLLLLVQRDLILDFRCDAKYCRTQFWIARTWLKGTCKTSFSDGFWIFFGVVI